jgi:hypothetical protein
VFRGILAVVAVAVIWGLASATSVTAAPSCWQQLVRDWADGRIAGTYPVACYRQALARMPEDLLAYSSAPDDIEAALSKRVHQTRSRSLAVSTTRSTGAAHGGWFDLLAALAAAGGLTLLLGAGLALAVRNVRRV